MGRCADDYGLQILSRFSPSLSHQDSQVIHTRQMQLRKGAMFMAKLLCSGAI